MRLCGKCGAEVSEIAKFCEQCGIKLNDLEPKDTTSSMDDSGKPQTLGDEPVSPAQDSENDTGIEELDLTKLDVSVNARDRPGETGKNDQAADKNSGCTQDQNPDNDKKIIDLKEILESDDKVEMDSKTRREVLAEDEVFYKICPMCGEELSINKKLLENTPVIVKCLKCGHDTKIW